MRKHLPMILATINANDQHTYGGFGNGGGGGGGGSGSKASPTPSASTSSALLAAPPSYSAAIAQNPPYHFINHYQTQQQQVQSGDMKTHHHHHHHHHHNNGMLLTASTKTIVEDGDSNGIVADNSCGNGNGGVVGGGGGVGGGGEEQQQQLCVVAKMQKSVTITVTPQRSNSLDYLNFEEKRQLIASSLSLSDILQCNQTNATAPKDTTNAKFEGTRTTFLQPHQVLKSKDSKFISLANLQVTSKNRLKLRLKYLLATHNDSTRKFLYSPGEQEIKRSYQIAAIPKTPVNLLSAKE
ncbi:hypothetical protein GQX74_012672 [Glossina fuscipes]|nr:hypothetical protein GQX74_012672 [Glossina fuscipes]